MQTNKLQNAHRKLVLTVKLYTKGYPGSVYQNPLTRAVMSNFRLFCDLQDISQSSCFDDIFNLIYGHLVTDLSVKDALVYFMKLLHTEF